MASAVSQPGLPIENLEEQLENVIEFLSQFWDLRQAVFWRRSWRVPLVLWKHRKSLSDAKRMDVLSGRPLEVNRAVYAVLMTPAEQSTDAYKALVDDFGYHLTSQSLIAKFPGYNFQKLKRLHEQKLENHLRFGGKQFTAAVFAAATLILKD